MMRTLTAIGIALALVGSAHAQDAQLTVKLNGKSPRAVRTAIYQAAEKVCTQTADTLDPTQETCVEATYANALQQLRASASLRRTAYVEASSAGLR